MKPRNVNNEKGVAFILTLLVVEVLLIFGAIFVLRSMNEAKIVAKEQQMTQAFTVAEGGANGGLKHLDTLINTCMLNTINNMNPSTVISMVQSYVSAHNGLGFLTSTVKQWEDRDGDSVVDVGENAQQFTLSGTEAVCTMGITSSGKFCCRQSTTDTYCTNNLLLGNGQYDVKIKVAQKSSPALVAGQTDQWDFPYFYRLETTGLVGGVTRKVAMVGDFTVRVQRDNFAKYALFTNRQETPTGEQVWFTNRTNFSGPIQTNERFNFALNPSGTFDGSVKQYRDTARFYNNGIPVLLAAAANGTRDVPTFNDEFKLSAGQEPFSSTSETAMVAQATGGNTYGTNGIYVPESGGSLTGGIYIKGDASVGLSVDGSNNAVYTITQGTTTKIVTVNRTSSQTVVETVGGTTDTYSGLPNGADGVGTVIYATGNISNLHGTVQQDTSITVASHNDMSINDNLLYSQYTAAQGTPGQTGYVPPNAVGTNNLMGIVSWAGNVRISTSAPDNINVHGTVLAQNGVFQVDNYADQWVGSRGIATLLGGVITDDYGAFGQFNGTTGLPVSGYGRNFVYDERMKTGSSPPYFPTLQTFIAFTNDIVDKITQQEGGF